MVTQGVLSLTLASHSCAAEFYASSGHIFSTLTGWVPGWSDLWRNTLFRLEEGRHARNDAKQATDSRVCRDCNFYTREGCLTAPVANINFCDLDL